MPDLIIRHTAEGLDRVIEAVRRSNVPLVWENDVTRANQKIYELCTAGQRFWQVWRDRKSGLDMQCAALDLEAALASARKWEYPDPAAPVDLQGPGPWDDGPCGYYPNSKSDPRD